MKKSCAMHFGYIMWPRQNKFSTYIRVHPVNTVCHASKIVNVTYILTLSTLYTKTDAFANSVEPDETAHNEPSHQDLHCLQFYFDF